MDNKNTIVGLVGIGMVGGAHKRYFDDAGYTTVAYDPGKGFNDPAVLSRAEVIFLCVPTPYSTENGKHGFDISYVEKALTSIPEGKIVVIKSTMLPGSTDRLQKQFPKIKILFGPEFLSEATADDDTRHPKRQIMGYTDVSKDVAQKAMDLLPDAPFKKILPAREAEMIKYFGNTWYATKVVFANQMYDLCHKLGIDYDAVKECGKPEPMVGASHLEVFHKGYRGYGGACLPKDTKSLIQFGDEHGVDMALLKKVDELNEQIKATNT
jgi:UDPglucose 6-dehydrogenase